MTRKYDVLCVLDLDVEVLESTPYKDVEKVVKNRVRILLDGKKNIKIHDIRMKVKAG